MDEVLDMEFLGDTFGLGLAGEPRLRPVTTFDHSLKACVSALTPNCTEVKINDSAQAVPLNQTGYQAQPVLRTCSQPDSAQLPCSTGSVQLRRANRTLYLSMTWHVALIRSEWLYTICADLHTRTSSTPLGSISFEPCRRAKGSVGSNMGRNRAEQAGMLWPADRE